MHLEIIVILSECIYRYYESRRRVLLDSKPARIQKKFENDRKTKFTQRQRTVCKFIIAC